MISISSGTGAPLCIRTIGWHFFFFLLRRKLGIVSQVQNCIGVLLKVARWVDNGHKQLSYLFLIYANETRKFPRPTSATQAISVLNLIILPLQTFLSQVLLLRKQVFSHRDFHLERPTTMTTAIKTKVFMFCYEHVNSTRKFTIFAEIVFFFGKRYMKETSL